MESLPNSPAGGGTYREVVLDVAQLSVEGMERMDGSWILDSWIRDGNSYRQMFLLSVKGLWIYICYVILS